MSDTRTFRIVDEDGDYYEITGDPMDALNAAYRERANLVALLAAQYPSHIGRTDADAPDWVVVTIELPTGQACWHIAADDLVLFGHVQQTPAGARPWDGHSAEEKYQRIRRFGSQTFHELDLKRAAEWLDAMAADAAPDGRSATEAGEL